MQTLNDYLAELIVRGGERSEIHAATSELLTGLAEDLGSASAVWHPLGFVYLPLHRKSEFTLRLHIWAPDLPRATLTTSPYHSHAWDLTSYVYCGRLRNILIRVWPVPEAPNYRVFRITGDGQVDVLRPTKELVSAEIESVGRLASGQTYAITAGRYHATDVDDRVTATVVVVRRRDAFSEYALGPVTIGAHRTRRQPVPRDLLARLAASVLRAACAG